MSLCDTCHTPGHCCRHIRFGGGDFAKDCETVDEANAFIADQDKSLYVGKLMPFKALFKASTGWIWWCPNLNRETGRCDDYDNRPFCCENYEPGADKMCVYYEEDDGVQD